MIAFTESFVVAASNANPCLTNNGGCSAQATCTNTASGVSCTCYAGFSGNGLICNGLDYRIFLWLMLTAIDLKSDFTFCLFSVRCIKTTCIIKIICLLGRVAIRHLYLTKFQPKENARWSDFSIFCAKMNS